MIFIANYATFHSPLEVTVFSNCERVRLNPEWPGGGPRRNPTADIISRIRRSRSRREISAPPAACYSGNTAAPGSFVDADR